MTYTFKERFKPSYTAREELGIHAGTGGEVHDWRVVGRMPEIWEDIEEWRTTKAKRETFFTLKKWDSVEMHGGLPPRIPLAYEDKKIGIVLTENCRDQLKANGHYHLVTTTANGYEFYLFAQTWDFIEDICMFDTGIDYIEGSLH